jgi:hypothetical protein
MPKRRKTKYHARPIVTGYLEKVNADVFDRYQKEITDMTKGGQGVYALYRKNKLYYVGLATNLRNRIKHHLKDRHKDHWTHFSLYIIRKVDHIKELESLLLRIAYPTGNSQKGKLKTSVNLMPSLLDRVKETHEREIDKLFKSTRLPLVKDIKKVHSAKKRASFPLKGLVPAWKRIYATYKGGKYKAKVCPSGRIKYDERLFDTPSAAGEYVQNRKGVDGWLFWKIKSESGQLVHLSSVRK